MASANVTARHVIGVLELVDASGNTLLVIDGPNRKATLPSGTAVDLGGTLDLQSGTLDLSGATVALGSASLATGYIPLPLGNFRKITTNDFGAIAVASGNGGQLATDTTPILQRINAATDKKARIAWVAADQAEIQQDFTYPPDLDDTAAIVVNLIIYKNGNTDTTAVVAVGFWEGIGDTEIAGNTAAITETVATVKTVSVAASGVGAYPNAAAIRITPGAHANDAIYLLGAYITYTRKTN